VGEEGRKGVRFTSAIPSNPFCLSQQQKKGGEKGGEGGTYTRKKKEKGGKKRGEGEKKDRAMIRVAHSPYLFFPLIREWKNQGILVPEKKGKGGGSERRKKRGKGKDGGRPRVQSVLFSLFSRPAREERGGKKIIDAKGRREGGRYKKGS